MLFFAYCLEKKSWIRPHSDLSRRVMPRFVREQPLLSNNSVVLRIPYSNALRSAFSGNPTNVILFYTAHSLDIPPVRLSLQSASGRFRFMVPPSGTTCRSTSHLRRHSRFSGNDSRPFRFFRFCQLRYYHNDSRVTITIHHYCLDTCGPCNN